MTITLHVLVKPAGTTVVYISFGRCVALRRTGIWSRRFRQFYTEYTLLIVRMQKLIALIETSKPKRLFSEPALLPESDLHMVLPASLLNNNNIEVLYSARIYQTRYSRRRVYTNFQKDRLLQ